MSGKAAGTPKIKPKAVIKEKLAVKAKTKKSGTTLTADNLAGLGAEVLADVLMELAAEARIKRRLRYELLSAAGQESLPAEVGKQLDTIAKATSFIDRPKLREFARDLDVHRRMITGRIATSNPVAAFELMSRLLALARLVSRRTYEIEGVVGDVFREGCDELGRLALAAKASPEALAKQIFGLLEDDVNDLFSALISSTASALGRQGQETLRAFLASALNKRPAKRNFTYDPQANILRRSLMELADVAGDPDAFIAVIPASERVEPFNGARIARRLLSAGRSEEALAALEASSPHRPRAPSQVLRFIYSRDLREAPSEAWEDVHLDVLDACGQGEEAQRKRWSSFQASLSIPRLRAYLKALPDFDDVVAEDQAMAHAAGFKNFGSALAFLIEWPNLAEAARLVLARSGEINSDDYEILVPAARRLEGGYPVAATLLLRAVISFTLTRGNSARYKHAAKHLLECESLAGLLPSSAEISSHEDFVAKLRAEHGRKYGFKAELEALGGVF